MAFINAFSPEDSPNENVRSTSTQDSLRDEGLLNYLSLSLQFLRIQSVIKAESCDSIFFPVLDLKHNSSIILARYSEGQ